MNPDSARNVSVSASAQSSPSPRVLVVDDDPVTRLLITRYLQKHGYTIAQASDLEEARGTLLEEGILSFDCVVTDYLMPGGTGLELLDWLKGADPTMASVMATAVGERSLIQESLRGGACDFLDKPVEVPALLAAVGKATELSRRKRQWQEAESSVREVGRFQQLMLGASATQLPIPVEVCWHPKHPAGGDLVNVFRIGEERLLVLAADVSGHDLKAAFISAFFQGIVRGMVEKGAPIQEIFAYFNRFLLHEWNNDRVAGSSLVAASISTCAFVVDVAQGRLSVWNSGFPVPVYQDSHGHLRACSRNTSFPLGWFDEISLTEQAFAMKEGGCVFAWTDGLEELAASLGVQPLSLADQLLESRRTGQRPAWLEDCADDILLVRLPLPDQSGGARVVSRPLAFQRYELNDQAHIDQIQAGWEKTLGMAVATIPESKLFDLLLCSREAVLNGLKHGCKHRPTGACTFAINYFPADGRLRVTVSDPGPGHDFNWARHLNTAADELPAAHRGLVLIHSLPDRTEVEHRGATVTMDFDLLPRLKSPPVPPIGNGRDLSNDDTTKRP